MANDVRKIDWDTGLKARGLFALAAEHYRKSREYEVALVVMLGIDDGYGYGGCLSDQIYDERPNFDKGLELTNIKIMPKAKAKRR